MEGKKQRLKMRMEKLKKIRDALVTQIYVNFEVIINLLPYFLYIGYFIIIVIFNECMGIGGFYECTGDEMEVMKKPLIEKPVKPTEPIHASSSSSNVNATIIYTKPAEYADYVPPVPPTEPIHASSSSFMETRPRGYVPEEKIDLEVEFNKLDEKVVRELQEARESIREFKRAAPKIEETVYAGNTDSNRETGKDGSSHEDAHAHAHVHAHKKEIDVPQKESSRKMYEELKEVEKEVSTGEAKVIKEEKAFNESWRSRVKRASDWAFSWSLQEMIFIVVFAAVAIPVAIISAVHILPLVWRICVSAYSTSNWFIGKTIGNMWRPTKVESFAQGAKDVVAASAGGSKRVK
jgi:hypothetical protein